MEPATTARLRRRSRQKTEPSQRFAAKLSDYHDNIPEIPQRAFEADYPRGAVADDMGKLRYDIEGRTLIAPQIAGRRMAGGGEEALEIEGIRSIGETITGRSIEDLPERYRRQGWLGDIQASERAGRDSAAAAFNPIAGAMSGPGAFPPPPGGSRIAYALAGKPTPKPGNPNLPSRFDFARADTGGPAGNAGGPPDVPTMESYIRQSAARRGIDPGVAVRVARSEGLQRGTWQSNVIRKGIREPSYGPFQLLVGGEGTGFPEGVGNRFTDATGLDPADPANWRQGIDFALDTAGKQGWGQWYGSKAAGISPLQGIGTAGPAASASRAPTSMQGLPIEAQAASRAAPAPANGMPKQPAQGGQFDLSRLPAAAGGTADTFDASKGPTLPMLFNALQNPWLNETQRGLVKREIERVTKPHP